MKHDRKLVVFDIDGTLTKGLSWLRFHLVGGVTPQEQTKWRNAYLSGNLSYGQWVKRIATRYRKNKVHYQDLHQTTRNIDFHDGAHEVVRTLQKRYELGLASSSPDIFVTAVARALEITQYYAVCRFHFRSDGYFQTIKYDEPDRQAKATYLKRLTKKLQIRPDQIVYVGESENDLEAFKFTGRGILVGEGTAALKKVAWKHIPSLEELNPLLE